MDGRLDNGRGAIAAGGSEDGFTLVEVMVAALVLIVGILGVLTMLTGSLGATAASNKRIAATNLARELVETTRGLDYDNLGVATAQLQARGLGAGSPWTIERRGVTYTVTATTCAFDDPSDGYAPLAPPLANACNTNAAGTDSNGDDFRRVTFALAWDDGGTPRSMSQSTLIVNPSGGLGPRILTITPVAQTITANVSSVIVDWTTTPAQSLHWDADDGIGTGDIAGTTSFRTDWNIGTSAPLGSLPNVGEVLDGSYSITATPFDDRDIAGEAKRADVVLNRRKPYPPTGFKGGHDTRAGGWVDLEWSLNRERDILGYRVVWAGTDGVFGNGNDAQVCPATGSMLPRTARSCADFSARTGAQTYFVVAIDSDGSLREGEPQQLTIAANGGRPDPPTDLTVTTIDNEPVLDWRAPDPGGVAFYRIYRDGTDFTATDDDRYATTDAPKTKFRDSSPGTTSHQYWITAVNSDFNESDPVGPVTWSP